MATLTRKIPGFLVLLCVISAAILNSGTVRKKQSPISKAQTAGIKLSDKLEELKDGEKGPATPSFGWYGGKNGFMSEPPLNQEKPESQEDLSLPPVSEVELPSSASTFPEKEDETKNGETWYEEWADEDVKEDEALQAKADIEEDASPSDLSGEADTSKDKKSSKWDKDWWDEI